MAHPEVNFLRNRAKDMEEAATNAVSKIQEGNRSDSLKHRLRSNLRETRGLLDLFDIYTKQGRDGVEDWIKMSLNESVSIYQVCLSEFPTIQVPQDPSAQLSFAPSPAD